MFKRGIECLNSGRSGSASEIEILPHESRALTVYRCAGVTGDLHVYDPVVQTWTDLSLLTSRLPAARWGLCITAVDARLYVHGGYASGKALIVSEK
jgi:hypothetical protein